MSLEVIDRAKRAPEIVPYIRTEKVGEVTVGRLVIPSAEIASWHPNETVLGYIKLLNGDNTISKRKREHVTFSLNHNSPSAWQDEFSHKRGVSAYYTFNPHQEKLIIEWGTIDPEDETAKLHTFLNKALKLQERKEDGMKITSGHMARTKSGLYLALLDNVLQETEISHDSELGKTINTLHGSGFIPLTADGFVKLPVF